MVRRDRSLGGKEVVVGSRGDFDSRGKGFGGLSNPLSLGKEGFNGGSERVSRNWVRVGKRLPEWWPKLEQSQVSMVDKQEYQREANRLIRGSFQFYSNLLPKK